MLAKLIFFMSSLQKQQVRKMIDQAKHILLLTDERIDGDTVGSTLGMYHALHELGKEVQIFSPLPLPKVLNFLPDVEVIQRDESVFENHFDLMMIFDCSDGEYFKPYLAKMKSAPPLIVFDHHLTNPRYGQINFIDSQAAAAASIVWEFIKDVKLPINKQVAQSILTGIITDTNVFSTISTRADCLDAAHELSRHGAKIQEIIRETMMNRSVPALKLWGLAFERLHQNETFDAIVTAVTQKDLKELGALEEDMADLSSYLFSMIEGAETVIVLRETDDGAVKASCRSQSRDVAALCARFGGGGHRQAAGFKISEARLESVSGKWVIKKSDGSSV